MTRIEFLTGEGGLLSQWMAAKADNHTEELEKLKGDINSAVWPEEKEDIDAAFGALVEAAAKAPTEEEARIIMKYGRDFPRLEPVTRWKDVDPPEPLIKKRGIDGAVLHRGDILVISGAGGAGKSRLVNQLAFDAAVQTPAGHWCTSDTSLLVKPGRVALLSFEDGGNRIFRQLDSLGVKFGIGDADTRLNDVGLVEMTAPIFGVEEGAALQSRPGPLESWQPIFAQIAEWEPVYLIIDPAGCAFATDTNSAHSVRLVFSALLQEARKIGCGIILTTHSNKLSRRTNSGENDANLVSGSTAWTDAARGAMALTEKNSHESCGDVTRLRTLKANYCEEFDVALTDICLPNTTKPIGWKEHSYHGQKGPNSHL